MPATRKYRWRDCILGILRESGIDARMDLEASSIGHIWHLKKHGMQILTLRIEAFDEDDNLIHEGFIRGQDYSGNVVGIAALNLICKRFHLPYELFKDCQFD